MEVIMYTSPYRILLKELLDKTDWTFVWKCEFK